MGGCVIRAVIWDMDGVLADTGPAHYAAWCAFMAERGRALTFEQFPDTLEIGTEFPAR